jgi:hypothetical protein
MAGLVPWGLPTKILLAFLICPTGGASSAPRTVTDLMTLTISGYEGKVKNRTSVTYSPPTRLHGMALQARRNFTPWNETVCPELTGLQADTSSANERPSWTHTRSRRSILIMRDAPVGQYPRSWATSVLASKWNYDKKVFWWRNTRLHGNTARFTDIIRIHQTFISYSTSSIASLPLQVFSSRRLLSHHSVRHTRWVFIFGSHGLNPI